MGTLDVAGKGLITTLEEYLGDVLKPALKSISNWGELEKSPSGKKLSRAFVEAVDAFIGSLHGMSGILNQGCLHPYGLRIVSCENRSQPQRSVTKCHNIKTSLLKLYS